MFKILSLSLDPKILESNSSAQRRQVEYSSLTDELNILVFSRGEKQTTGNLNIYPVNQPNKILKLLKGFVLAKKIIREKKINLITVQDQYFLALLGLFLSKKFKIGLELQIHGFEKFIGVRKVIANYVLPRADSIRVVSQRLKKRMVEEFGVEREKITVVPIFVESGIRNQESGDRRDNKKFIFLTIGRLAPVKNIGMQIEAMAEVIKKYSNTELWIVGEGELRKKLKVRSQKLGIKKNVKFLGWQNNVIKFYEQADVFMLTSNSEGWPLVIVEAASHSLPIIMTDTGSAGELVKDQESSLVIPVGAQKELEKVMIKLIEDRNLREKLGRAAHEAVLKLPGKQEIFNL
ncbi:hypothetical protein COV49_04335, partial [Candidatus Falkowbacteria bacterium CG11_big_fil_rev_8_21_14_0_20_39_10]